MFLDGSLISYSERWSHEYWRQSNSGMKETNFYLYHLFSSIMWYLIDDGIEFLSHSQNTFSTDISLEMSTFCNKIFSPSLKASVDETVVVYEKKICVKALKGKRESFGSFATTVATSSTLKEFLWSLLQLLKVWQISFFLYPSLPKWHHLCELTAHFLSPKISLSLMNYVTRTVQLWVGLTQFCLVFSS